MLAYMVYWKPFRSKYTLYSAMGSETMFAGCTLIMYSFIGELPAPKAYLLGWLEVALIVASMATSWICVVAQQLRIYRRRKLKKAEKEHAAQAEGKDPAHDDNKPVREPPEGEERTRSTNKQQRRHRRMGQRGSEVERRTRKVSCESEFSMAPGRKRAMSKNEKGKRELQATPKFGADAK